MDPTYEATLSVVAGPAAGLVIPIHRPWGNVSIGSDPACSVVIPAAGVAAIQARLWIDERCVTLYSNAPQGLSINGHVVEGQHVLRHGDVLVLGVAGENVALEYREPMRAESYVAAAVAVGGGLPSPRPVVPLDPSVPLARPFVPATRVQRVVRDVLQISGFARTAFGWRLAQARTLARRQVKSTRAQVAAAGTRLAPSRPAAIVPAAGPRAVVARRRVRQAWRVRLAAAWRLLLLKLGHDPKPAVPALRLVGGTQHRPVPGARRLAAARAGHRFALLGITLAVMLLALFFFRPAVRGIPETLAWPGIAAAAAAASGGVVLAAPPPSAAVKPAITQRPAETTRPRALRRAVKRASL